MKKGFLFFVLMLLPGLLLAQPQSENFVMAKQVLDAGGAPGASENFEAYSAYGQPSPIGLQSSESFNLSGGFLSPIPLNLIQQLVIIQDQPDVILYWEPIAGANSYKIYRSDDPMFTPEPGDLIATIGTAPNPTYTDEDAVLLPLGKYFYNVTASSDPAPPAAVPPRAPSRPGNRKVR